MHGLDVVARAEHHGPLHHVVEFAHIARPGVGQQNALGFWREGGRGQARLGMSAQHLVGQGKDVFGPLAQCRNGEPEGADSEVKVFAELTGEHRLLQVFVGRSNEPEVEVDRLLTTQARELALLQYTQQLCLQVRGQFANFIEKHRATLGLLKDALVVPVGPRVGTALMAKEHVFHQVLGNGPAVKAHEGAVGPARRFMNDGGQNLFARARGAGDEGGDRGLRHALGERQQLLAHGVYKHKCLGLLGLGGCSGLVGAEARHRGNRGLGIRGRHLFGGRHVGQRCTPGLFGIVVCGNDMAGALAHGFHGQAHVARGGSADDRNVFLEGFYEAAHFGQELGGVHQAHDHGLGGLQGMSQVFQGAHGQQAQARSRQALALGLACWLVWIQPECITSLVVVFAHRNTPLGMVR